MEAFRRDLTGDIPAGSTGLNLDAVKAASHNLYLIDGQLAFDRAMLYVNIYNSMTPTQIAYLQAMKGKGFNEWPNITDAQITSQMGHLPQGTATLVMTYASDIFSWYEGSLYADVYFCPERHGTYYGGFYIKDAPAVGVSGYTISEQLTATTGSALIDSSLGYVTPSQAAIMDSLVNTQRNNLYAGDTNIVSIRTQIASLAAQPDGLDGIERGGQCTGAGAVGNVRRFGRRGQLQLCDNIRAGESKSVQRPADESDRSADLRPVGNIRQWHGVQLHRRHHSLSLCGPHHRHQRPDTLHWRYGLIFLGGALHAARGSFRTT